MIISGGGGEDIDADVDADVDADTNNELSFGQFLGWAGIGKAPLILLLATDLSLWGVFGWMLNVWFRGIINNKVNSLFGLTILFFSMIISLLMGGLIARPIGKIFAEFGEDASSDRSHKGSKITPEDISRSRRYSSKNCCRKFYY
nr:OB-fold-containig protein [Nostoc sp. FACHB-888]